MKIYKNASKNMLRLIFALFALLTTPILMAMEGHPVAPIPTFKNDPKCAPQPCNVIPPLSFWVDAECLYWFVQEDGLEVGVAEVVDVPTPTGSSSFFRQKLKSLNFEWTPGFRVGIGQGFNMCCGWQTALYWTHINSRAHRNQGAVLKAHWKVQLDMVDAVVARDLWYNRCTSFNLFAGIRGARIRQNFRVFEVDTLVAPQGVEFSQQAKRSHSKYFGIGPRLGLEGEWRTICDLSLYGNVAVSALFGHLSSKFEEADIAPEAVDACEVHRSQDFCQAVTDFGLGVRWRYCACSGFKTLVQIGFEHHQFYKQNKICDCGDLCFDGVVASLVIGF